MNSGPARSADDRIRVDLLLIADMVETGSRVIDIGCENGTLLSYLADFKQVDARGLELRMEGVRACVSQGLSVIQGNADRDLKDYPDDAFDYAILSQTLQATHRPKLVLEQLLRIGRHVIVSFPNFGHWRARLDLTLRGRMPQNENLPVPWYETPNIHFCTIRDFVDLCSDIGATIERSMVLDENGTRVRFDSHSRLANLFGNQAVFMLSRP